MWVSGVTLVASCSVGHGVGVWGGRSTGHTTPPPRPPPTSVVTGGGRRAGELDRTDDGCGDTSYHWGNRSLPQSWVPAPAPPVVSEERPSP